jgi:glucose-6-phosphate 1-dehydrogenase
MEDQTFLLFGASGDLAKRKIIPALYNLFREKKTPEHFNILGLSRSPWEREAFQKFAFESLKEFSRSGTDEAIQEFLNRLYYLPFDANKPEDYAAVKELLEKLEKGKAQNRMFYLAVAPNFFGKIAMELKASGLTAGNGWKRLIIEKPFGHDLESATALNAELYTAFDESEIFRIDHYLGKEMVQNIEVIRFANSIFEPLWNNRHIANVQITSNETVGVEERAGYYESAGALRDMVQNHMLQMLMMVAMEPPSRLKTEAIRDEKVKVLRSLRRYEDKQEIVQNIVRGQYLAGKIGDKEVVGYLNEKGVSTTSSTETFVAAKVFIDNFRWAGVPFYIRTGKRMASKTTKIVVQFKDVPENVYFSKNHNLATNLLIIQVNPSEGISLTLNAKHPGEGGGEPIVIDFAQQTKDRPEAYERLIFDAINNDSTFFTRWDEVSNAWKWIDPISQSFASDHPLYPYVAGSNGPDAADRLLAKDGFRWWN